MLSSDLANRVEQYLANAISLNELNHWLAGRLPSYIEETESDDAQLVGTIELGLAEMDDDILTEDDLRRELRDFMQEHPSVEVACVPAVVVPEACIETGSVNETVFPFGRREGSGITTTWAGTLVHQVVPA